MQQASTQGQKRTAGGEQRALRRAGVPVGAGSQSAPEERFTFLEGDVIDLPTPGSGRPLEWWHCETTTGLQGTEAQPPVVLGAALLHWRIVSTPGWSFR